MDQSDPQRHMQNGHPVRTITVIPGSDLEALLKRMEREKTSGNYTTLDAVARDGCHAAVARPMSRQNARHVATPEKDAQK
jgi:hypothetical protein